LIVADFYIRGLRGYMLIAMQRMGQFYLTAQLFKHHNFRKLKMAPARTLSQAALG